MQDISTVISKQWEKFSYWPFDNLLCNYFKKIKSSNNGQANVKIEQINYRASPLKRAFGIENIQYHPTLVLKLRLLTSLKSNNYGDAGLCERATDLVSPWPVV